MITRAALAALILTACGNGSAHADDTPAYVTPAEFKQIDRLETTKHRARVIFDVGGYRTGFFRQAGGDRCAEGKIAWCATQYRIYPTEAPWGWVSVQYVRTGDGRWRVAGKMANWGDD